MNPTSLSYGGLLALSFIAACGGSVDNANATHGNAEGDGGPPVDAGSVTQGDDAATDSGAPDASPGMAGDAAASSSCDDLLQTATAQAEAVEKQNLGCREDDNCTWGLYDHCVSPCGTLVDQGGYAALEAAQAQACQPYAAAGCPMIVIGCFRSPPVICSSGACTTYGFGLVPNVRTLPLDVCQAFQFEYAPESGPATAPHDLTATVTVDGGATLYSDTSCTTPFTGSTLTIPAGATGIPLGFKPTASGYAGLVIANVSYLYQVQ